MAGVRDGQEPNFPHLTTKPHCVADNVTLQTPLSRRGIGPGLLVLVPSAYCGTSSGTSSKTLDPEPLQKWAEEGFAVIQVKVADIDTAKKECAIGIKALQELPQCSSFHQIGVVVYDLDAKEEDGQMLDVCPWHYLDSAPEISAIVAFTNQPRLFSTSTTGRQTPLIMHTTVRGSLTNAEDFVYIYDDASSPNFVFPNHKDYRAGPAGLSHTRTLAFLRGHLGGPHFNLETIWDEHCAFEFSDRSVEKTMATMVDEPYVNHIPTMTGGIGRAALTAFYRDHFIFNNPPDTKLELISRTVGVDRVIDEFIFCFTHTSTIDWLVPGIPPTNRFVRIPFTSVVNIRGDRLYHEHIAWDQASVLRQLGLMPEYLPYPYPLPDGRVPAKGKRFEYRVPTAGAETASKMVDENSVESNQLLGFQIREVDI